MNLPEVKIEDLLESGVHFGHNVRRWNPKMEEYIFGVRNNIHIFDLRITVEAINSALIKLHETVSKSGKVLFVGTKKQCSIVVKELAELNNYFYVNKRWLGGMLTNWKTISKSINRLKDLETFLSDPSSSNNVSKKELLNIDELRASGFEQHAEILCKVIKNGDKFYEVPISYNGRNYSEGKKIRSYHFFTVLFQFLLGRIR